MHGTKWQKKNSIREIDWMHATFFASFHCFANLYQNNTATFSRNTVYVNSIYELCERRVWTVKIEFGLNALSSYYKGAFCAYCAFN